MQNVCIFTMFPSHMSFNLLSEFVQDDTRNFETLCMFI